MHAQKKYFRQLKAGTSLIEVLVAMFIFVIMIVSMTSVFVTLIHKRSDTKKMQQQTEEFSLAMSYMTKKIRMSDIEFAGDCTVTTCKVIDHGASSDIQNVYSIFDFNGITLTETIATEAVNPVTKSVGPLVSSTAVPIASDVTGGFVVRNVTKIPTITIHMMSNVVGSVNTSVQTTASLRSYK